MDDQLSQEIVRELITDADRLSRSFYEANQMTRSGRFAALRTTLQRIERHLGGDSPGFAVRGELDLVYQRIRDLAAAASDESDRHEMQHLLAMATRLRPRPVRIGGRGVVTAPVPPARAPRTRIPWLPLALGAAAFFAPLLAARMLAPRS